MSKQIYKLFEPPYFTWCDRGENVEKSTAYIPRSMTIHHQYGLGQLTTVRLFSPINDRCHTLALDDNNQRQVHLNHKLNYL